jgi:enolase
VDLIARILAWEALDSRGTPTVACSVRLESGAEGDAVVPSGASTGSHEARERRDGGKRYAGKGVAGAVAAFRTDIEPGLVGRDAFDQNGVDAALRTLDGTPTLERLGANAVLAASVACAIAAARSTNLPLWEALSPDQPPLLPLPMVNVISGGAHAGRLVDVQDFLVIPVGARTFAEAIEWASRVRSATAAVLRERGHGVALVADEGGLAASLSSNRAALDVLLEGIERSGLEPGVEAAIAVDVAATQLLVDGKYVFATENRSLRAGELVDELAAWVDDYPIVSIEDALGEDDEDGWQLATTRLAGGIQLLGDDLFVTSPARLSAGIQEGIANAVLVKPNQVGTLSDAHQVVTWLRMPPTPPYSRPARARLRTAGLPIWRSGGGRSRSRWAQLPVLSARQNGTGCCVSSPSARTQSLPGAAHCAAEATHELVRNCFLRTRKRHRRRGDRRGRTSPARRAP